MTRDELEFSISQYIDGTLADAERGALEERLATDASARALLTEYESLQGVLAVAPLPNVQWDQLASRISGAVAQEAEPAQSYKIGAWRPGLFAAAASVLIAAGVGFSLMRTDNSGGGGNSPEPVRIVRIDLPATETVALSATPASEEPIRVAIGPSTEVADKPIVLRYADSVVQRPARAVIVSAAAVGQDSLTTPF